MSDFPQARAPWADAAPLGNIVTNYGLQAPVGQYLQATAGGGNAVGAWPVANTCIFTQILVPEPVTAYKMGVEVGTQSGNYDVGIYSEDGVRLVSIGSTAVPAAGFATIDITDTALKPGLYWLAMWCSNTTATFERSNPTADKLAGMGVMEQTGQTALPATATFAAPANAYFPWMGAYTWATGP